MNCGICNALMSLQLVDEYNDCLIYECEVCSTKFKQKPKQSIDESLIRVFKQTHKQYKERINVKEDNQMD